MIKEAIRWLSGWLACRETKAAARIVRSAARGVDRSLADLRRVRRKLKGDRRRLEAVQAIAADHVEEADRRIEETERAQKGYQDALDSLRAQLQVSELQIAELEAAHRSRMERLKSEVAVEVRRQVAASGKEE